MPDTARIVETISPELYLEEERLRTLRHEYVDGHIYAMAGATERHNRLGANLLTALTNHLPDRCVAFMADMKVRVRLETGERFYYPDSMVCCGPGDQSRDWRDDPLLIGEVLSPKTEHVDRGDKLEAYKQIPTLSEYVIVDHAAMCVEVYRRVTGWKRETSKAGDFVKIASIEFEMAVEALYRRVIFESSAKTTD